MNKLTNALLVSLSLVSLLGTACTGSADRSEASSSDVKSCDFEILVFSSYTDENNKMVFDFEKMESWTQEGTHHYAIVNNKSIKTASVEILKNGKTLKSVEMSLEKVGAKLTQLSDKDKVKKHLREMGELKPKMALRFVFNAKSKDRCKKDIGIFVE